MSAANPTADTAAAPAPKSRRKLLVGALAGLVIVAAGAAGGWWYLSGQAHAAEGAEAPAKAPAKTFFVNLDPFTVNLHDPRGERFAQVGITLEIDDPKAEAQIKDRLPAVRNNILLLLSAKEIEALLAPEGKQQLALEIREQAGQALGIAPAAASAPADAKPAKGSRANPIRGVLFSQFIVQ
ncbi:flagellar basal body-associated FliL family protein [Ramlibacter sp. MAHUQ-53]|uniref:flagellar basal body-associated FliL family protein n=1 Tax=unclassified Ramlibacter TaxID=2617605 RepID=UPI0036402A01